MPVSVHDDEWELQEPLPMTKDLEGRAEPISSSLAVLLRLHLLGLDDGELLFTDAVCRVTPDNLLARKVLIVRGVDLSCHCTKFWFVENGECLCRCGRLVADVQSISIDLVQRFVLCPSRELVLA